MVSAAFITYDDKLLLFHRDDRPVKDPDCWDLIGGHDEPGELPEETLVREIHEEISISPKKINYLFKILDTWGEETHLFHVVLSEEEAKAIKLGDEGKEVVFFNKNDMMNLKLTQNMKLYLREFSDTISSFFP